MSATRAGNFFPSLLQHNKGPQRPVPLQTAGEGRPFGMLLNHKIYQFPAHRKRAQQGNAAGLALSSSLTHCFSTGEDHLEVREPEHSEAAIPRLLFPVVPRRQADSLPPFLQHGQDPGLVARRLRPFPRADSFH